MVTAKTGTVQKFPKPRGRAPKNASGQPATWDPDRGEWTGVVKKTKPDGVPKPRGRAPLGATWDYDKGKWVGGTKPSKPAPKTLPSPMDDDDSDEPTSPRAPKTTCMSLFMEKRLKEVGIGCDPE